MTIYFDKNTADARELEVKGIYINPVMNTLSASNNIIIKMQTIWRNKVQKTNKYE